jgi:hypothetical protein
MLEHAVLHGEYSVDYSLYSTVERDNNHQRSSGKTVLALLLKTGRRN